MSFNTLVILDTAWGPRQLPNLFSISPTNKSGRLLYKLMSPGMDAHRFVVGNACELTTKHAALHGTPDVSHLAEVFKEAFSRFTITCTKICAAGNKHYGSQSPRHHERLEALAWTLALWELAKEAAPNLALENPRGCLTSVLGPYAQEIQPWWFGESFQKTTCLWLHNIPPLVPTNVVDAGEFHTPPNGQRIPVWYSNNTSGKDRSVTFQGIANAMAQQWGDYLLKL